MSFRGRGGGFRGRGGNNFFDFLILMTSLKCFITSLQSSSNFSIYIKLSTIFFTAENCPEGSESEIHAEYITLVY